MAENDTSPQKHIAVIGAGIVGVSTAIWLQRAGHRVTLIDREGPAAGTSYGNGGVLASCAVVPVTAPGLGGKALPMLFNPDSPLFLKWRYLPKLLPWLIKYMSHANVDDNKRIAKALTEIQHDSVDQHIAVAKGTPAEKFIEPGEYVFIYEDRAAYEADAFGWGIRKEMGFQYEELEGSAVAEFEPAFKGPKFAVKAVNHGHISDPGAYVKALADHAVDQGAELIIEEVVDIQTSGSKATAVVTKTRNIQCDELVLATGAWSGSLTGKLGANVPLESERGYHIELVNASTMPKHPCMIASGKFVVTPMNGRLRCAGIVEFGGLDAPPSEQPFKLLEKQIHALIPDLKYDRIERWMGHRPAPTDSIPLIGPFSKVTNAHAAFGHHHVGLTGGPKTGRIVADLISGKTPNFDLTPYSPSRFD